MLAFIPVDTEQATRLRAGELTDVDAHITTPALFDALGLEPGMEEDAEFAALTYASVAALTRAPRRIVLVADVPEGAWTAADFSDDFGRVVLGRVAWSQVNCLFVGDDADAPAETAASVAAAGMPLADAWENPSVAELVATSDLLWYAPQEVDAVVAVDPAL